MLKGPCPGHSGGLSLLLAETPFQAPPMRLVSGDSATLGPLHLAALVCPALEGPCCVGSPRGPWLTLTKRNMSFKAASPASHS